VCFSSPFAEGEVRDNPLARLRAAYVFDPFPLHTLILYENAASARRALRVLSHFRRRTPVEFVLSTEFFGFDRLREEAVCPPLRRTDRRVDLIVISGAADSAGGTAIHAAVGRDLDAVISASRPTLVLCGNGPSWSVTLHSASGAIDAGHVDDPCHSFATPASTGLRFLTYH
jgi:hypothetical protein